MITKLATFRGVTQAGDPLVQVFHKGDSLQKFAGGLMPEVEEWLRNYKPDKENIAVLVSALGASEFWGQNSNGDGFRWGPLSHDCSRHSGQEHPVDDFTGKIIPPYGYKTFLDAGAYAHHKNKDKNRAFGTVAVSVLNRAMRRVELVVIINRKKALEFGAQDVVDRIDGGEFPDVSMGTRVPYDLCYICGNKSKTRNDYCFPPGTLVSMADGSQRPIESIAAGDFVLSSTGVPTKVTALMERNVQEELVEIRHTINGIPLLCTGNHPILSSHRELFSCYYVHNTAASRTCFPGATQWCHQCRKPHVAPHFVEAEDLRDGDSVYSPAISNTSTSDLDEFSAYMIGLFEAEGCFAKQHGKRSAAAFAISSDETDLLSSISKFASRFGREAKVYKGSGKGIDVRINSSEAAEFLFRHAGEYAHQKFASKEVASLPVNLLSHYIKGLWDGDGHISDRKPGYSRLNTASLSLAFQTSFLLRKLGYPSYLGHALAAGGPGNRTNTHDQWYINTSYGFDSPMRRHSLGKDGLEVGYVKSVERVPYSGTVYNFETEDHTYVANGIAVHNCNCIKNIGMGVIMDDGRKVGVDNPHPRFFDISFVFIGADKTAKVMVKLGSGIWMPRSVIEGELLYGPDEEVLVKNACGAKCATCGCHSKCEKFAGLDEVIESARSGADALVNAIKPNLHLLDDVLIVAPRFQSAIDSSKKRKERALQKHALNLGATKALAEHYTNEDGLKLGPPPSPNRADHPFVGTLEYRGLKIDVENKQGDTREGTDKGGHKWKTLMHYHYGEIRRTAGTDGDKLDVYVGRHPDAKDVYIVHQNNPTTGKYDEDKCMIGFVSAEQAKAAYLKQYDNPKFFRSLTVMPFDQFKESIMGDCKGEKVAFTAVELGMLPLVGAGLGAGAGALSADEGHRGSGALRGAAIGAVGGLASVPTALALRSTLGEKAHYLRGRGIAENNLNVARKAADEAEAGFQGMREVQERHARGFRDPDDIRASGGADDISDLLNEYRIDRDKAVKEYERAGYARGSPKIVSNITPGPGRTAINAAPWVAGASLPVAGGVIGGRSTKEKTASKKSASVKQSALKAAEQKKWAEIVKEIEPTGNIGRVSAILSEHEPELPRELLDALGEEPGLGPLSTPSAMGMMLKPKEFQRIILISCGQRSAADDLDSKGIVFAPKDGEEPVSSPLGAGHFQESIFKMLAPFLGDRSYFGPVLRKRIIMVNIKPKQESKTKEASSPLLDKIAQAYNWYCKEMIKVAVESAERLSDNVELNAAVNGLSPEGLFKGAMQAENIAALGSVPLTLLYSAYLRGRQAQGEDLNFLNSLVAEHPILASLGGAYGLKTLVRQPEVRQYARQGAGRAAEVIGEGARRVADAVKA